MKISFQLIRNLIKTSFLGYFLVNNSFCLCIVGFVQRILLTFNLSEITPQLIGFSAVSVVFGRLFCGFICPFGIIFEWTYKLKMKINNSKILPKVDPKIHNKLIYLKYILLIIGLYLTFKYATYVICGVCPIGSFAGLNGTVISFILLGLFIILGYFIPMFFCRYFCPIGALLGLLSVKPVFKIKSNDKCNTCRLCEKKCPMQIDILDNMDEKECIRCFQCVTACKKGGIKYGK
ncbi:ferredoxin-type protein NapH [Methanococcus maripaludis]|uniref:Ferredoxin-type protein NapH n=1 Tax=Methanococcus maripaludis TaxID=39152 RepID=A0A7J9NJW2_METMI|nr:4Fe-4S binding protein [Methanococcus maripaludis]MBA2841216.1 ferredoxin-type protein NapH [Methanococcus maripaludis]